MELRCSPVLLGESFSMALVPPAYLCACDYAIEYIFRAYKTQSPKMLAPIFPLSFVWGYQYDMAVGNKMDRVRSNTKLIQQKLYKIYFKFCFLLLQLMPTRCFLWSKHFSNFRVKACPQSNIWTNDVRS